jgi:hypothetical protein
MHKKPDLEFQIPIDIVIIVPIILDNCTHIKNSQDKKSKIYLSDDN